MKPFNFLFPLLLMGMLLFWGCTQEDDDDDDSSSNTTSTSGTDCTTSIDSDVPAFIRDNFTCVTARVDGSNIVITTKDLPPHASYYYGSGHSLYEALPSGKTANPNSIQEQNIVLTIPLNPTVSSSTTDSSLGAVGVAINSVAIFNNQAAPGDTLADEIKTFDGGNGHPQNSGMYHYHIEPTKITSDDSKLIGVLLDGFPVYGKKDEDGSTPSDLDAAHGHTHATSHFPAGLYHYHVTDTDPYIVEKYRGTPGTVSQ